MIRMAQDVQKYVKLGTQSQRMKIWYVYIHISFNWQWRFFYKKRWLIIPKQEDLDILGWRQNFIKRYVFPNIFSNHQIHLLESKSRGSTRSLHFEIPKPSSSQVHCHRLRTHFRIRTIHCNSISYST